MPNFKSVIDNAEIDIHYAESGDGFPLLVLPPGGMRSAREYLAQMPWNPLEELSDRYRVIVMDQRNAGASTAPVSEDVTWRHYTQDQLALMDHLGCERFHVFGMCIGGPFIMGLMQAAPERVASAIIAQSIGLDDNQLTFYQMFDDWAQDVMPSHPDVSKAQWQSYRSNMFDGDFMFNVDREFVSQVSTPLVVLLGDDIYHPQSTSRAIADLATNAELIEDWKEGEARAAAKKRCFDFLELHTP